MCAPDVQINTHKGTIMNTSTNIISFAMKGMVALITKIISQIQTFRPPSLMNENG